MGILKLTMTMSLSTGGDGRTLWQSDPEGIWSRDGKDLSFRMCLFHYPKRFEHGSSRHQILTLLDWILRCLDVVYMFLQFLIRF